METGAWQQIGRDVADLMEELELEFISLDSPVVPTKTFIGTGIPWSTSMIDQLGKRELMGEIVAGSRGFHGGNIGSAYSVIDVFDRCVGPWTGWDGKPTDEYVNNVCEVLSCAVNTVDLKSKIVKGNSEI